MSEEHHTNYVKIWGILVVLLVVSVIGPMFGHRWLTLVTAFGIACVKAFMVAKHFMHINLTPKFVTYTMVTCLVFMFLFFTATAPDIMKSTGANWQKPLWVENEMAAATGHGATTHGHEGGHSAH